MAAPQSINGSRIQRMLQSAVQAVQWTYSLFWQFCPQQGMLIWGEGYYNGPIKTRKTVMQPMEVISGNVEDPEVETTCLSLQRSQKLRELYESLSAGGGGGGGDQTTSSSSSKQPPPGGRRPCAAALTPEDLTELEWFYLMCVSFTFPSGVGLPGQSYAKGQHVWLTGANEVDSKVFSRAILAKSACIQTVVCIPLMGGVVELGFTERVQEDSSFIQKVKSFFIDHHHHNPPARRPKPALSEHSTSNPSVGSHIHPAPLLPATAKPPPSAEEEENGGDSDSEAETGRAMSGPINPGLTGPSQAEPSELMQLELSEDIRLGSPEDASNNLDPEFHISMAPRDPPSHHEFPQVDSFGPAELTRRWPPAQQHQQNDSLFINSSALQLPPSGDPSPLEEVSEEDIHYSQTVSIILAATSTTTSASLPYLSYSPNSAFSRWSLRPSLHLPLESTSQWLLKYILFTVPFLHIKCHKDQTTQTPKPTGRFRRPSGSETPHGQDDQLSANHVLAERRRREKLNERFIILRSLVPFVTKMDKASILGDTIEYVKQLRKKIQDLETRAARQIEGVCSDKRKVQVVAEGGTGKAKAVDSSLAPPIDMLQVSIIESDALIELHCAYKEGLLLDVMLTLRDLRIQVTSVQSLLNNGFFKAELRAKVKENLNGKKASIVEVKRAINKLVPHANL